MKGRQPVLGNRITVSLRAIPGISRQIILREAAGGFCHQGISRHFRENGGCRNREIFQVCLGLCVELWHRLSHAESGVFEPVIAIEKNPHSIDGECRTPHQRLHRPIDTILYRPVDVVPVDIAYRDMRNGRGQVCRNLRSEFIAAIG